MKRNKGFTLLELLVVMSVLGVLTTIVVASLGQSRNKANITAFKSEVSSAQRTWASVCMTEAIVAPNPAITKNVSWGAITQTCGGVSSSGTFSVTATATRVSGGCTATVTHTDITYVGC